MKSLFELGFVIAAHDAATAVLRRVENQFNAVHASVKRTASWRESAADMERIGIGMAAIGGAAALALREMLEPAMAMQAALAHVRTAMDDGVKTSEHLKEIEERMQELQSSTIFDDTVLAQAYYIARSNAATHKDALEAVAQTALLVQATSENAQAATASLEPTIRAVTTAVNNFGGSSQKWTDAFALLQTQYAFKNIDELVEALKYAMPVMKTAGISANDAFAAIAGLQIAGLHGTMAGTAFRQFVTKLSTGKELKQYAALTREGGLDVAASLERLHKRFAGMKPIQVQREIKRLGFGIREATGVGLLVDKGELIAGIIRNMGNSAGTAAQKSADRMGALDMQLAVFSNNVQQVKEAFGNALIPALNENLPKLTSFVHRIERFLATYPQVAKYTVAFLALAAATLVPLGSLIAFAGGIIHILAFAPAAAATIKLLALPFTALTGVVWSATTAVVSFLLTNPVGWAILAVAAIAAVIVYWDKIRGAASAAWEWVKRIWGESTSWWSARIPEWYEAGVALLKSLASGMLSAMPWPVQAAVKIAAVIRDHFVGKSPPPVGPLHDLGRSNLMRTLAEQFEPSLVLAAVRRVAVATSVSLMTVMPVVAAASAPPVATPSVVTAPTLRQPVADRQVTVHLHYAPTVNAGDGVSVAEVRRMLDDHLRDALDRIKTAERRAERAEY